MLDPCWPSTTARRHSSPAKCTMSAAAVAIVAKARPFLASFVRRAASLSSLIRAAAVAAFVRYASHPQSLICTYTSLQYNTLNNRARDPQETSSTCSPSPKVKQREKKTLQKPTLLLRIKSEDKNNDPSLYRDRCVNTTQLEKPETKGKDWPTTVPQLQYED